MNPGIVKVAYFSADSLPDFTLPVLPNEIDISPVEVELAAVGSISEESKYSPVGLNTSTKLEFTSPEAIPVDVPVAFLVEDADGYRHIVGNAPPHCGVLTKSAQINDPSGKASVNYYSFSLPLPKYSL